MFQLLESRERIAKAQKKLESTIRSAFKQTAIRNIGHPGGHRKEARVRTDGNYWFWSTDHSGDQRPHPRRLNWFGLFQDRDILEISVEINIPHDRKDNNVAGFFARDTESGSIYLFHNGRVGGGRKGVGKSAFLVW